MKYWKGYKYVIAETFSAQTAIIGYDVHDDLTSLVPDGTLTIRRGYAWDGNSGPCMDTKSSMEASAVHDALCDYVNLGLLPGAIQPLIDEEYFKICVKKKMWRQRARARLVAIRWYMTGKGAKRNRRKVYEA